jgi:hypothetical protein
VLSESEDSELDQILDNLKIDQSGNKLRFKKACQELRESEDQLTIEKLSAKNKVLPKQSILFQSDEFPSTPQIQQMKNSLSEIMQHDGWLIQHADLEFLKSLGSGNFLFFSISFLTDFFFPFFF